MKIAWPLTCRGFFSEYNLTLWMLLHARLRGWGFEVVVDERSIVSPGLARDLLELRITEVAPFATLPPALLFRLLWRSKRERRLAKRLDPLRALHELHNEVWKGCTACEVEVAATLERLGLTATEPFISMHIRRGDKLVMEARYVAAEVFVASIPPEFRHLPIVVGTDDYAAFEELRESLARAGQTNLVATTASPRAHGHDEARFNALTVAERDGLIRKVVVDFCLMQRSAYFVGSFSSNMSRSVHVARAGRNSCSVDTDFRFVQ